MKNQVGEDFVSPVRPIPKNHGKMQFKNVMCTTPRGTPVRPVFVPRRSMADSCPEVANMKREREILLQKAADLKGKIDARLLGSQQQVDFNDNEELKSLRIDSLSLESYSDGDQYPVRSVYYNHDQANYTCIEQVGMGSFGVCHLVQHMQTGRFLCRKTIDLCVKDTDIGDVRGECSYLNKMDHPNCLKLFDLHVNPSMELFIYMEYCPWSLESLRIVRGAKGVARNRLNLSTVMSALYQTLKGLDYLAHFGRDTPAEKCKSCRLVHTDIKSDNLLVSFDGKVKIGDFGIAVMLQGDAKITDKLERGSEAYMAPEVSNSQPYWEAADMYSLGVTAFELLTGHLPSRISESNFWDRASRQLSRVVRSKTKGLQMSTLLQAMMDPVPTQRPTPEQLLASANFGSLTQEMAEQNMMNALERGERLYQSYLRFRAECQDAGAESFIGLSGSEGEDMASKVVGLQRGRLGETGTGFGSARGTPQQSAFSQLSRLLESGQYNEDLDPDYESTTTPSDSDFSDSYDSLCSE